LWRVRGTPFYKTGRTRDKYIERQSVRIIIFFALTVFRQLFCIYYYHATSEICPESGTSRRRDD
jgi:hypothetical protein